MMLNSRMWHKRRHGSLSVTLGSVKSKLDLKKKFSNNSEKISLSKRKSLRDSMFDSPTKIRSAADDAVPNPPISSVQSNPLEEAPQCNLQRTPTFNCPFDGAPSATASGCKTKENVNATTTDARASIPTSRTQLLDEEQNPFMSPAEGLQNDENQEYPRPPSRYRNPLQRAASYPTVGST